MCDELEAERLALLAHLLERLAAQVGIADVAAAHPLVGDLELRLDQHHALGAGAQAEGEPAQHVARGDEADVDGEEVERARRRRQGQRLPVHALEVGDARVALQRRVELPLAHVDGGDVGGAVRQQRLGEAARRGADVDRARAAQACREAEALDGGLELEPAATDPTAALALH